MEASSSPTSRRSRALDAENGPSTGCGAERESANLLASWGDQGREQRQGRERSTPKPGAPKDHPSLQCPPICSCLCRYRPAQVDTGPGPHPEVSQTLQAGRVHHARNGPSRFKGLWACLGVPVSYIPSVFPMPWGCLHPRAALVESHCPTSDPDLRKRQRRFVHPQDMPPQWDCAPLVTGPW